MIKKHLDESKAKYINDEMFLDGSEEEEVSEDQIKQAFNTLISDIIKQEFASIELVNSSIATIDYEDIKDKESILAVLKTIVDEKNIHIGMLTKILELLDDSVTDLMNAGIEKAETILSEPSSIDLK